MKIYIAALYSWREKMELVADYLKLMGHEVTSRWVYGNEEGKTNEEIAVFDLEDVDAADVIVSYTLPYGSKFKGGGRAVEFGYGLAKGKRMVIIGERENVFNWFPGVERYDHIDGLIVP